MKYLCLVYLPEEHWSSCPDEHCAACATEMAEMGSLLAAEPLHKAETATSLRIRNGQMTLTDGPFAETKEILAGFYLVDAKDLNAAINLAAKIPPAQYGTIEIRPVRQLDAQETWRTA